MFRSKQDVINEAKVNNGKVHFATLINLCHLEHPELAGHVRKNEGRVVLRGDSVKDDIVGSGHHRLR